MEQPSPQFSPLAALFGVEARGVDIAAGVDDLTLRRLVAALYEHRLLLLRDQSLDAERYGTFARRIGSPYVQTYDQLQVPGHPALMQVGNVGPVLSRKSYREGAGFWHTDRAYATDCNAITALYCLHAPRDGSTTLFADQVAAWEALDTATRRRIGGLFGRHRYGAGELEDWETAVHPMVEGQQARLPPAASHPLARRHDLSGRVALYAKVHHGLIDGRGL